LPGPSICGLLAASVKEVPEVPIVKRPFVSIALGYGAGVALGGLVSPALPPAVPAAVAAVLAVAALLPTPRRRAWIGLLLATLGLAHLTWREHPGSAADLRRLFGEGTELVAVRGRLLETPVLKPARDPEDTPRTLARLAVEAVRRAADWEPAEGALVISTTGQLPEEYFGGRAVEVYGVLRRPAPPVIKGLFDYRAYLRWQGIHYELLARTPADWRQPPGRPGPAHPPIEDRFIRWAQAALSRGLPVEDEAVRLLWAMTLGWRTAMTDDISRSFVRTGTMHIFAISGLHIALIAAILVACLRVLQVPRPVCGLVVAPALWFYTAATGWQPSAIRSTLMMTVIIGGWTLRRPGDMVNSLAGAAFLILVWEPRQLFHPGFQLSFVVVLAMALGVPPIDHWVHSRVDPDPLLPEAAWPAWRRWVRTPLAWLVRALATSGAAWLGSLPLIAHYFHMITPVSLIVNVVMVPLSSFALMCNLGSLVTAEIATSVAELFNHSGWFWMRAMMLLADAAAGWPGAWAYVPSPGLGGTAVYYAFLLGLTTGWLFDRRRRPWLLAVGVGVAGGAAVVVWREASSTEIVWPALPGGAAAIVDAPGRARDLVVDAGDASGADAVVLPFLQSRGVNRVARMLLSHGDARHVGGAEILLREMPVAQVMVSSHNARSPVYRRIRAGLEASGRPASTLSAGAEIAGWQVLHPGPGDASPQADDASMVLRREFGPVTVLLVSDLGKTGQRTLLDRGLNLRADLVVAGMPTAGGVLSEALLAAIQPRVILLQDAFTPVGERVTPGVRSRLESYGVPVLRLTEHGSLTLRITRSGWSLRDNDGRRVGAGAGL